MMKKMIRCFLAVAMVVSSLTLSALSVSAESTNLALGKTAVADSVEASTLTADKAFDGVASKSSRWSCAEGTGSHWIYVDLGSAQTVGSVRLYWENRKATSYKVQVATELSSPMSDSDWTNAKVIDGRPASIVDTIYFDTPQSARYVRVYIDGLTSADPDGGVEWPTVSIFEFEVYETTPPVSIEDLKNSITVETPKDSDEKLVVNIPEIPGYTVTYNGTDLEQVVDADLNIHSPIVDKTVKVSFKIQNDADATDYTFKEVEVTIPGIYSETSIAPLQVLPELQEWKGAQGTIETAELTKIVYSKDEFKFAADELAREMKELYGYDLLVEFDENFGLNKLGEVSNAICLVENNGYSGIETVGEETYVLAMNDSQNIVTAYGNHETGIYWATRTILQAMAEDEENHTLRCGTARDYPLYRVRGVILDVGRKTFTMDFLKQMAKQMAWYKMNDFQIHLNDNYIWLEEYTKAGEDPMTAYSGFRLESDIKEGGNNGLNKADLTSKDVFYTKDEFREFIQTSRKMGVNIVPEIDTPAHSLALTRVRPDLRNGTSGRDNDHLDLANQYDATMDFIKSIFGEYMTEENPVFDLDTIVHIGADEYHASSEAYRKYVNDMFAFVQDTGRKARVWGSFTYAQQGEPIDGTGVEINLWNWGYANWDKMYEKGFNLINCDDGLFYVVPNADYYGDYFNANTCYNRDLGLYNSVDIPAGDPQMAGAAIALWNDMIDKRENGMSEYDLYVRLAGGIPMLGANTWGKGSKTVSEAQELAEKLGDAPGTNFGYEVVKDENGKVLHEAMDASVNLENAEIVNVDGKDVLELKGGSSFMPTHLQTVGLGNALRVKVKRTTSENTNQILFESPYGNIKAVNENGKVGFYRENHEYEFNYSLPVGQWVELEFRNEFEKFSLYVNGALKETIYEPGRMKLKATMMFPVARIGSQSEAFIGFVDNVRLGTTADYYSTKPLENAVDVATGVNKEANNEQLASLIARANELLDEYAPEATTMIDLTDDINAILETMDYAKANYAKVNVLAAIANDLSAYTDETAYEVLNVLETIRYGLPAASQAEVDAAVASLEAAIAGLEVKEVTDLNYVSKDKLNMTASSYQKDGSDPNNVLDGDENTMWHTDWTITSMPHWIQFNLDQSTSVNGLTYLPRSGGGNGTATSYEVKVSNDNGSTFTTVKTGTLAGTFQEYVITFDAVNATNVRFVINAAKNNNGSASEMKLSAASVEADVEGLEAVIASSEALIEYENMFTIESWNDFVDTIIAASALVESENPDPNAVESAKNEIAQARKNLKVVDSIPEVVPGAVEGLRLDETDYKTFTLVWEAVEGATVYDVYRKSYKEGAEFELLDTVVDPIYEASGLMTGKTYSFYVVAKNDAGESEPSGIVEGATTLQGEVTLAMEQVSTSKFHLSWNKVDGATRYIVYRKRNDDKMKKVLTLGGDVFEYTTAEMPNGDYTFQVKAGRYDSTDRVMTGASNKVSGTVEAIKPTVTATAGTKSAKISWKKMEGVTHYQVYRATSSTGKYTKLTTTKELSYTAKSLTKGKKYYFKVRGYKTYKSGTDIKYTVYTPYSSVKSVTAK